MYLLRPNNYIVFTKLAKYLYKTGNTFNVNNILNKVENL